VKTFAMAMMIRRTDRHQSLSKMSSGCVGMPPVLS